MLVNQYNKSYFLFNKRKINHISIDDEKEFDKVLHHFMLKTLNKMGTERFFFNIVKAIYTNPFQALYSIRKN